MAILTITIPDDKVDLVLDALWNQRIPVEGESEVPTKVEWARMWIKRMVVDVTRRYAHKLVEKRIFDQVNEDILGI